jgi:valyl-tRNA synthetase
VSEIANEKMNEKLSDRYNPAEVENRIYTWWEDSGYFKAQDQSTKPPFSVILPPPNVTGFLHLGHCLDHTIQDVLVRWKRMSGFNTLWLPGTDHAGIATQAVVEKELKKQSLTRSGLGREKFVEKVWEWKHQYGDRICNQMRRIGDSVDWDRNTFTLDEGVSKAVRKVFVSLYKKEWIYRGTRLVNWSGPLETAISDLEVEHQQIKGTLYHIDYPIVDDAGKTLEGQFLTVATTRPETLLGDTAVAVHPEDTRYNNFIGKKVALPLTNRLIPIIADTYVDKDFGSGVVKITPAHDFNDFQVGKRHNLEVINLLTRKAEMNENAGPKYQGLKVNEARKKVIEDLKALELLRKEEPHLHSVGHCSRSGAVVEPFLSDQWFVKTEKLATPAKRVVESGTIKFEPESWTKTYLHWLSIIEDWCISRQLWWGHRIPAWYCESCSHITVSESNVTQCEKCASIQVHQDEDVLDTWFSSALWPFSTMGWPNETETQKTFYPTNVLVTGHDIIFFWVSRMIMMGLEFKRDVPFRDIIIHGLVRDSQGRKMSKSLGNSLDPVALIETHGADALRFTIMAQIASGKDLKFSEQRLEGYRNFMNKIWNATRFSLTALGDFGKDGSLTIKTLPIKANLSLFDMWIIYKTGEVEKNVELALLSYRFSDAANALYHFVWHEFCDWYIEFIKPVINGNNVEEKQTAQLVIAQTLNRIMRLLHPFTPFITEEIYQKLPIKGKACIIDEYPTNKNDREWISFGNEKAAFEVDLVKEVITAIRNIRGENRIKPGEKIAVRLAPSDAEVQKILGSNKLAIENIGRINKLEIGEEGSLLKCAVAPVIVRNSNVKVIIPLEGLVDFDEEIKRIQKTIEKLQKDQISLSGRLNNENFIKNAAEDVVETDRVELVRVKSQITSLEEALGRFGA